jgi:enoyl-CoA hydratase/carnithine racemase
MIEINREHKNNILTIEFMEDLRRSLEAMEIDEYTKCVLMYPKKGEVFSVGTDLKSLHWAKINNNERFIDNYFKKLYDFQNFLASFHKPLISYAPGLSSKFNIFFI